MAHPGGHGLRGRPLIALRERDLKAWLTEMDDEAWTRDDLMAHHAVVTALDAAANGCLPARFATHVSEDLLRQRYDALSEALSRVEGRSELAVTAVWTSPPAPTTSGTAYLRVRAEALRSARRVARLIEEACGDQLVQVSHRECPSQTVALSSALLVPRARADVVKMALPRDTQDVRILVNGPWPPYSFAGIGGGPAGEA